MLSREEIETWRAEANAAVDFGGDVEGALCAMALQLLDIAELVPGEGDVVERVRALIGWPCSTCRSEPDAAGPGCDCAHAPCIHDRNGRIAALEAELAETQEQYSELDSNYIDCNGQLVAAREQLCRAEAERDARDEQWRQAWGPGIGGPRNPDEGKVFLDEAKAVVGEVIEKLTAERDEARRRLEGLTSARLCSEFAHCDAERDALRAKLATLANAAERYRAYRREHLISNPLELVAHRTLGAAIAEARKP
jgi:hypothetical protein